MAIPVQSYFAALRDYLNKDFKITEVDGDRIVIKDKIFQSGETIEKEQKVRLKIPGEALVINLDKKQKDSKKQNDKESTSFHLFNFLNNESKPWAKRCDFVIFHLYQNQITAFCIEFKSASFPESLVDQMNASTAWCRSVHSIIKHYTGKTKRIKILKFVLSCHLTPERFLDEQCKYLSKDHTIRHYNYKDIDGLSIDQLENEHSETIG